MAGIKPTDFSNITPTGITEVYTQTGGVNGKFTLEELKSYIEANLTSEWTETTVNVSSAQILAMGTTPIELLPAPGVGKYYEYEGYLEYNFGTAQYVFAGIEGSPYVYDSNYNGTVITDILTGVSDKAVFISNKTPNQVNAIENTTFVTAQAVNSAILLSTWNGGDPTLGDGTIKAKIKYKVVTFG